MTKARPQLSRTAKAGKWTLDAPWGARSAGTRAGGRFSRRARGGGGRSAARTWRGTAFASRSADQQTSTRPVVLEGDLAQIHRSHVRLDRPASGRIATPIPAATIWHIASKLRTWMRIFKLPPERFGLGLQALGQRRALGQADEVVLDGLVEAHAPPACQSMAARHDEHEPVIAVLHHLQAQGGRAIGEDAEVGATVQHRQHDFAAVFFLEFDPDAGVRLDEGWRCRAAGTA